MNFIFPEILNVAENGRKRENTPYGVTRQEVAQGKGEKLSMSGFSDLGCCLVYLPLLRDILSARSVALFRRHITMTVAAAAAAADSI